MSLLLDLAQLDHARRPEAIREVDRIMLAAIGDGTVWYYDAYMMYLQSRIEELGGNKKLAAATCRHFDRFAKETRETLKDMHKHTGLPSDLAQALSHLNSYEALFRARIRKLGF
ncbi:MAG: hypothetical protein H6837_14875 [Planctomycetes bacterium]|nr:hypothetical protein [Planctomycetota bacterium]